MDEKETVILAIDDNEDNLVVIKALINDAFPTFKILLAGSGKKGVELCLSARPSVILLDLIMPGMDGFEVCSILKSHEDLKHIPIIILTAAKSEKEYRIKALELGADAFLTKPIDEAEFIAQIKAMLRLKDWEDLKRNEAERLSQLVLERTQNLENELIERKRTEKELQAALRQLETSKKASLNLMEDLREEIEVRKKTEEAIRESEAKFSVAFRSSPNAIAVTRPSDGRFIEVNDAFITLSGYNYNELLEMTSVDLNLWINCHERDQVVFDLRNNIKVKAREYLFRRKTGETIIGLFAAELITINKETYILSNINDITSHREMQFAIRKSEQEFRTIWESSQDGMRITNSEGIITRVNESFCKMFGRVRNELEGKPMDVIYDNDPNVLPKYRERFRKKTFPPKIERKLTLTNKEVRWLEVSIAFLNIQDKELLLLSIFRDISIRKQAEIEIIAARDKAEEMNRLKSSFLANMSHELRTPMVGILGYSEVMAEEAADPEFKNYANIISKSAKRLMNTLNLILDYSKIDADKATPNWIEVDIGKVITDVLDAFRETAKKKNLELNFKKPPHDLNLFLDETMFREIMNNLINNGIIYTKEGNVTVSVEQEKRQNNDWIMIKVIDTGIGIKEEHLNLIWQEFRQVSEGKGRSFEGTGLGLSITKKFVEKLNGQIHVESEFGKGSIFTIQLPLTQPAELYTPKEHFFANEPTVQSASKYCTQKPDPTVLYVEDDAIAFLYCKKILSEICTLERALDSQEAMEKVSSKRYDAILMDINLRRGLDGAETTKLVRQKETYRNVPIVAVTAYAMEQDKLEFLKAGCDYYLSKPFNGSDLKTLMKNILADHNGQRTTNNQSASAETIYREERNN